MPSSPSTVNRIALAPTREVGRQRVAALLDAAASLFRERGYEAATMAEIALRAGARIGSLYRFFPNKEAVADALLREDMATLDREFVALEKRAGLATAAELADLLIDLLVTIHPRLRALPALQEARTDVPELRAQSRARALAGIAAAVAVLSPGLAPGEIAAIAAVLANNMKTMLAMTLGDAPTSPDAPEELRLMNRQYLAWRLARPSAESRPLSSARADAKKSPPDRTASSRE